jgi:8-oxo-dGTP pyrophosphatase MutT (NUDIX family)
MAKEFIIYFNNRKLVITQKVEKYFEGNDFGFFFGSPTLQDLPKLLEIFKNHLVIQNLFVGYSDPEILFKEFASNFNFIETAGGLVQNEKGEYLLIFRRGKWDLPKGKIESGEKTEHAAIREVKEETGLNSLTVIKQLTTTYHTYIQDGLPFLKRTYWYSMKSTSVEQLIPQTDEDIERVEWVNKDKLPQYLKNTYGNINLVFNNILQD